MKSIAAILFEKSPKKNNKLRKALSKHPFIAKVIVVCNSAVDGPQSDIISIQNRHPLSGKAVAEALHKSHPCPFLLFITQPEHTEIFHEGIERLLSAVRDAGPGLQYANYFLERQRQIYIREVIDYQFGSIRDDFFFGPLQIYSRKALNRAIKLYGKLSETTWAGLYELRLKVSLVAKLVRIPDPLSILQKTDSINQSQFAYVDPAAFAYQQEMENIATEHLKHIGAYLEPSHAPAPPDHAMYPVEASVVIPVRNREQTIADAVKSALEQKTSFAFNVLVVQNYSVDRTGEEIEKLAKKDSRVITIVPRRRDLEIGGCWNEAVSSPHCGRYVCQLDSDDLYEGDDALATMIAMLREGNYGMVVGTYRVVDFNLNDIPPGLVEHREWSEENGKNNLLRVHGIGAPRAFPVCLLRKFPFPNVSYGEDYAVALQISRYLSVGRIFKPIYLCRRWEGNTDAELTSEQENRHAFYKDRLRTNEILERIKLNRARTV
jgi:hypothetical protein